MAKKKTLEEFIADAKKIHGDRFDYSLVDYINNRTNVVIKCNVCKKNFQQLPHNHLHGAGCPHCAHRLTSIRQINPLSDVIVKLKEKYGDAYSFSLIKEDEYCGNKSIVQVICKKHGVFPVRLADLLRGHGCSKCARERVVGRSNFKNKSLVCGVGINDYWKSVYTSGEVVRKAYKHWHGIIVRCYSKNHETEFPSYKDCYVSDDWLVFSNFLRWFELNWDETKSDYHIDKDILVHGNRIYSAETCIVVPPYINVMLIKSKSRRGHLPIGVFYDKERKKYGVAFSKNKKRVRKRFDTIEEAFAFYKKDKESYIKEVAQKYYDEGKITKRVYDALMRYKIEITD